LSSAIDEYRCRHTWADRELIEVHLPDELRDWTDWDGAAYCVGKALGLFPETTDMREVKAVFWSENPLGDALHAVLLSLVAADVLERREEPDEQFRWTAPA
jgi:hypothetical protein